jgi:hypothetical protein
MHQLDKSWVAREAQSPPPVTLRAAFSSAPEDEREPLKPKMHGRQMLTYTTLLAGVLGGGSVSCEGPTFDAGDFVEAPAADTTLKRLRAMGFRDDDIKDQGDHYVVEGDMVFAKQNRPGDAAEDLAQRYLGRLSSREVIRVRIDSAVSAAYVAATVQAMDAWNNVRGTSVTFKRVLSAPEDIFVEQNSLNATACALADYPGFNNPFPMGSPGQRINILATAMEGTCATVRVHTMMHELGHAVGLRHTDACASEDPAVACVAVPMAEGADVNSIMASVATTSVVFTDQDEKAIQSLYPPSLASASRSAKITETFMVNRDGKLRSLYQFVQPSGNIRVWDEHGNKFPGGVTFADQITAVKWDKGLDVFGVGTDGTIKQYRWEGSFTTAQWFTHANPFTSTTGFLGQLTSLSVPGTVMLFGLGQDNQVKTYYWQGAWYSASLPQQFPGNKRFAGPLAALVWEGNYHIFGVGGNEMPNGQVKVDTLLQLWWAGTGWYWSDMAIQGVVNQFQGQISAAIYDGKPYLFGLRTDRKFGWVFWNGSGWTTSAFEIASGARIVGPVSAVSPAPGSLEILSLDGGFDVSDDVLKGGSVVSQKFVPPNSFPFSNLGNRWLP